MLQGFSAIATALVLLCAPLGAAAVEAIPGAAQNGYQRAIDVGVRTVEVKLHYGSAEPGSTSLAGEGSVGTALPGDGQLTLRLPLVVGRSAALGNAELAAGYDLASERRFLPSLGLVAKLELPIAPGTREARPRVKATAEKTVASGFIDAIRFESELWTDGPGFTPGYRLALGTTLSLFAATDVRAEIVSLRPPRIPAGPVPENLVQLGLSHSLAADTSLRAGVSARVASDANSIGATIGIDRRF